MKISTKLFFLVLVLSFSGLANETEFTKISDYKKVLIQFMKPIDLQLSQFVRDAGRGASAEKKLPNYRLLFESAKLKGPEEGEARVSCTVYEKTMLSSRVKNYAEEAIKFENTISEKTPITLSSETQWTITKALANELGFMLWASGDKKSIQIECEKKTTSGVEKGMMPKEVFMALALNEIRFFKDGSEIKMATNPKTEETPPSPQTE